MNEQQIIKNGIINRNIQRVLARVEGSVKVLQAVNLDPSDFEASKRLLASAQNSIARAGEDLEELDFDGAALFQSMQSEETA